MNPASTWEILLLCTHAYVTFDAIDLRGGTMWFKQTSVLSLLGLLACVAGWAQLDNASIVGTVRDTTGAVIPGAAVAIQSLGTSVTVRVTTDQTGSFAAPTLP